MFYKQLSVESMNHLKVNLQLLLQKVHAVFCCLDLVFYCSYSSAIHGDLLYISLSLHE